MIAPTAAAIRASIERRVPEDLQPPQPTAAAIRATVERDTEKMEKAA